MVAALERATRIGHAISARTGRPDRAFDGPRGNPSAAADDRSRDLRGAAAHPHREAGRHRRERVAVGRVVREERRQVARRSRPHRHRRRRAGRHPRRRDPQGPAQSRHRRLDPGRTLRRAGAGLADRVPQRHVPGRPLRVAARLAAHDRHARPAEEPDEVDHGAPRADAGARRGGAAGRGGIRRPVAGSVRRQHGHLGRPRRHDGAPPGLPSRRAVLLRRRARAAGRRRSLRLGPRDLDGGRLPLHACARSRRSPGRASRTPTTSWWPAARGR